MQYIIDSLFDLGVTPENIVTTLLGIFLAWFAGNFKRIKSYFEDNNNTHLWLDESDVNPKLEDIIIADDIKNEIEKTIELRVGETVFDWSKFTPPIGLILYGPPGVGKKTLIKAISDKKDISFVNIDSQIFHSNQYNQPTRAISDAFTVAKKEKPSIIYIENLDTITPQENTDTDKENHKLHPKMLNLIDKFKNKKGIIVIGAINRSNSIDSEYRRGGRFGKEIVIREPDKEQRKEILKHYVENRGFSNQINFNEIAQDLEGYVGSDIKAIVNRARLHSHSNPDSKNTETNHLNEAINSIEATVDDELREYFNKIKSEKVEDENTNINSDKYVSSTDTDLTWEEIVVPTDIKKEIEEIVKLRMNPPKKLGDSKLTPPSGFLLHGPPGTGKTTLIKALANEKNIELININPADVFSKWHGESEQAISDAFTIAKQKKPAIIFIDDLDSIIPERDEGDNNTQRKVFSQLLSEIDDIKNQKGLVVAGATNHPNDIDPALRRTGRFGREIAIDKPNKGERKEILKKYVEDESIQKDIDFSNIIEGTEGYVGSDLEAVALKAQLESQNDPNAKKIETKHFDIAFDSIEPSTDNNNTIDTDRLVDDTDTNLTWEEIVVPTDTKKEIDEIVELRMNPPKKLGDSKLTPPSGFLLHGPPGTGKTILVKTLANEKNIELININPADVFSKWYGESEQAISDAFTIAKRKKPAIIFIDDLDSIVSMRGVGNEDAPRRVLSQLLSEIDDIKNQKGLVVAGATNYPNDIDPALRRTGRFGREIAIGKPNKEQRKEILTLYTPDVEVSGDINLSEVAKQTEGYVGADLEATVIKAKSIKDRDPNSDVIKFDHFMTALNSIDPTSYENSSRQ